MHHHRWVVGVSRNVGMHGGAMTQLSRMGGHLGRRIAWLSHIHTHWTTPRHIIPWHSLQPCRGREKVEVSAGDCLWHRELPRWGTGRLRPQAGHGVSAELGVCMWTHNGNRNGSQAKNNPKNIPPPLPFQTQSFWR